MVKQKKKKKGGKGKKEEDARTESAEITSFPAAGHPVAPRLFGSLAHSQLSLDALSTRANQFFEVANLPVRIVLDGTVERRLVATRFDCSILL